MSADYDWGLPEQFNFTRDVVEPLAADPNRRALTYVDADGVLERQTFAQMAESAARWAHLLRGGGLQQGDRVLVLLGKVPAWLGVMLGSIKGGLVTVPCPDMLRASDIAFRVRHSEASMIVADRAAQQEIDAMRGMLDRPVDVLYLDDAELILKRHRSVAPTEDTRWYDPAFIVYTSGTTGHAKGVTHSHGYSFCKRMQAEHWLTARPGDLVWCTAGTGWAKSLWNVLLGPWSRGAEIVMHAGTFDAAERLDLIDGLGVTVLCQAPTEYRLMAKSESLGARPLSRLRHAVSAGEPLNPEVIERFHDAIGVTIYDGYGQTENTLLVANTRDRDLRPGSMGVPTPGHAVAVIDESGTEVEPGKEGDIALGGRPPSLFLRYWNARDETAAAFRGDWYITGDRAWRDDEGYFWFAGRADDVIISSGYRIGPFEIESALLRHPAVAESAAVAKPDEDRGNIVKAFVVLRPGAEPGPALAAELQEHARNVTAPYKYPREIEFVTELPKTTSGKIRRSELRRLEGDRAAEARPEASVTVTRDSAADVAAPEPVADEPVQGVIVAQAAPDPIESPSAGPPLRRAEKKEAKEREAAERRQAGEEEERLRAEEAQRREDEGRRTAEAEAKRAAAAAEDEARRLAAERGQRERAEAERRQREAEERRRLEIDERRRAAEAKAEREAAAEAQRRAAEDERRRREDAERAAREEDERRRGEAERSREHLPAADEHRDEPRPDEEPEPPLNPTLIERLRRYGMTGPADAADPKPGGDDAT